MSEKRIALISGASRGIGSCIAKGLAADCYKTILIARNIEKLKAVFYNVVDMMIETAGAEEAVKVAYKLSQTGDTVLLSPACASFDLFENYEDRGQQFKNAVRAL